MNLNHYVLSLLILFSFTTLTAKTVDVDKFRTNEKVVALTFDDGPHPRYTPKILAVLEKYDVKASFFLLENLLVNIHVLLNVLRRKAIALEIILIYIIPI